MSFPKINHRKDEPLAILRADYVAICQNDTCCAILLAHVEYWSNVRQKMMVKEQQEAEAARRRGQKPKHSNDEYFFKGYDDFREECFRLFGITLITRSLDKLINWGYVFRRRNPNHGWDKTYQYTLNYEAVQAALDALNPTTESPQDPKTQLERTKSETAIPETTTENTISSAAGHGNDALMRAVAKTVFGLHPPLDGKKVDPRLIAIVDWLREKQATPENVSRFVEWYRRARPQASLPRNVDKFTTHWQEWENIHRSQASLTKDEYLKQGDQLVQQIM